ncbi:hypothetical protein [Microcoleus sp. D2_18a_D3]|uniref:hypothetical protein n=1 Tax=Microcoleus sp. D2_18a_D3 TaxID=3055330 RepID=UPI002FD52BD1
MTSHFPRSLTPKARVHCHHNCASAKIICNTPAFTAVPYAAARVETSSRIENNSSSSLKGCRGAMAFRPASYGISYACCQNVLIVGRGLRFRRCGSMGVVSGVGCLLEG